MDIKNIYPEILTTLGFIVALNLSSGKILWKVDFW